MVSEKSTKHRISTLLWVVYCTLVLRVVLEVCRVECKVVDARWAGQGGVARVEIAARGARAHRHGHRVVHRQSPPYTRLSMYRMSQTSCLICEINLVYHLYKLVTQSTLRTCEENRPFFVKKDLKFATVVDMNKRLKHIKLTISL